MTISKLLQQTKTNRKDLVVIGIDFEVLVEDINEKFHYPDLLFLKEGIVGDPDDGSNNFQDIVLN